MAYPTGSSRERRRSRFTPKIWRASAALTPSSARTADCNWKIVAFHPRGKNDESVPNSRPSGAAHFASALEYGLQVQSFVAHPAIGAGGVEVHVGAQVAQHQRFAKIACAECGTMKFNFGNCSAIACRSIGLEKRMSKCDGSPSFLRTPTLSTPQCTNTTVPG